MSQDIRRERAGVRFETIAGATNYIADMERRLFDGDVWVPVNRDERIAELEAEYDRIAGLYRDLRASLNRTYAIYASAAEFAAHAGFREIYREMSAVLLEALDGHDV